MSAPQPDEDGLRRYHHRFKVVRVEDFTRCVESVYSDYGSHQCERKRGHGPDGLYCKQHNPEAIAAKRAEEQRLRDERTARNRALVAEGDRLVAALGCGHVYVGNITLTYDDARALLAQLGRTA